MRDREGLFFVLGGGMPPFKPKPLGDVQPLPPPRPLCYISHVIRCWGGRLPTSRSCE